MKTNAIVRIIIWSIVLLLLISILGTVLLFGRFSFSHHDTSWSAPIVTAGSGEFHHEEHHVEQHAPNCEPVTYIEIEWVAGTITIQPGDTDRILLSESGKFDSGEAMVFRRNGSKLTIEYQERDVYIGFFSAPTKDLTVTVPRDWQGTGISIDGASTRLNMTGITVREVELDNASGDAVFDGCSIEKLDIDTASGDVEFFGTLNVLEYDAASADLHAVFHNVPRSLDMGTASGDMDITLPDGCGFTAMVDALSGEFSSEFETTRKDDTYIHGDGSCRIDLSAMSGDVTIRRGK